MFDINSIRYLNNNTTRISKIDIVFNTYPNITKLLQSINWITRAIQIDESEDENDTFNQLMVYNNISKFDWFDTNRSLKIYDGFYFNNMVDMVSYDSSPFLDANKEPISGKFPIKNWDNLSSFISNFIVIRFTYNGTNRLIITDIIPELIKTAR